MKQTENLTARLTREKLTLATAESCTGGLIGAEIVSVAGASAVYLGGVIAYANAVKVGLLGVNPAVIAEDGAVSARCAIEMARGVRAKTGADIGISSTGIAGPGGGTADKPVGTVFVGISSPNGDRAVNLRLSGDRTTIRERTVSAAIAAVVDEVECMRTIPSP